MTPTIGRRRFLATTGLALSAAPFHALACRTSNPGKPSTQQAGENGYGPLSPTRDETTGLPLLHLPKDFRYLTFGWTGDTLRDGSLTPGMHDGMAAFTSPTDSVRLVRNHETRIKAVAFADAPKYDVNAGGGTTTLDFDTETGTVIDSWASLTGTAVNCAGGPTPWHSWLTCEETIYGPGGDNDYKQPHGYVFEVPIDGTATAEPLRSMGRFVHEAVSVDPNTGIVYETEDQGTAGFYRFLPENRNNLAAGGQLEMLALSERTKADLRTDQTPDVWHPVSWVPIDEPDPTGIAVDSIFRQGSENGGATFARLEGTWYGNGRIYIVSTSGGELEAGQVWEYDPTNEQLRLIYESPSADILDMPDNLCVSPRGGLILCEDGPTDTFIRGLTTDGTIFPFAKNNVVLNGEKNGFEGDFRHREFAGATFSADGRWLFFNAQTPGITFGVTGPWTDGVL